MVLLALKKFKQHCWGQIILVATDNTTVVSYMNKEGGHEIRPSLCPPLENALLVQSQADGAKGQAHSGALECDSGQTVQEQASDPDRVVSPAGGVRPLMCKVAHTPDLSFCHQVTSPTSQACVPSTGSAGLAGRCSQPKLGGSRCICFSTDVSSGQTGHQDPRSGFSKVNSHCPRVAQHALVLDMVNRYLSLPQVENLLTQPFSQCPHRDLLGLNLHAWLLEPLAYRRKDSLMRWQHELRLLRDSQPELSMNQSGPYLSNGVSQTRWTSGHLL